MILDQTQNHSDPRQVTKYQTLIGLNDVNKHTNNE